MTTPRNDPAFLGLDRTTGERNMNEYLRALAPGRNSDQLERLNRRRLNRRAARAFSLGRLFDLAGEVTA